MGIDAFWRLPKATLLIALALPTTGYAGDAADPGELAIILDSTTFLAAHPDMRWRKLAIDAHKAGRDAQAREYFQRAALYADKLSQSAYAEMLWKGEGGAQDRPLAYAWMDLAAQRRSHALLVRREYYWSQLDEAERKRAQEVGQAVYAQYGDKIAKPRQEREMRAGSNKATGSRIGVPGTGRICLGVDKGAFSETGSDRGSKLGGACGRPIGADAYYDPRFWKPAPYWAWQDQVLEESMH